MITQKDIDHHLRWYKGLGKVFASNAEETLPPEWKELLEQIRIQQKEEKNE